MKRASRPHTAASRSGGAASAALLAVLLLGAAGALAQSGYPTKPVRIVVPFAPGGANDLVIRVFGERLHRDLGQPFVVENRPGASGNIAAASVERAVPDGYTLLMGNIGLMVHNPMLYPKLGFDPKNFIPVSCMVEGVMLLKVPAASRFMSVADLVAFGKANPGKLNYASVGVGSPLHLAAELLMNRLGFTAVQIPYNGGGPLISAVIGGYVDFVVDPLTYGQGKVRTLAVLDAQRKPELPDVPTIEETGFPLVTANSWIGLFAPKGTPDAAVALLASRIAAAVKQDVVRAPLVKAGLAPCEGGQAEFAKRIRASEQVWVPLLKQLNIRLD